MIQLEDIYSLSAFQRDTKTYIENLKKTGRPAVLTVNGKAQVVVQDAASYQKMLNAIDQAEEHAAIRRGLESVARGEGEPVDVVFDRIARKLKLKLKP